jgi:outer membrane protein assembly factor BamB
VIGSTDGSAHALDPQTGEKKWSYEGTNPGTNLIYAPILGAGDLVYLTTSGGEVVALDSKTGDTRWTAKLGGATETAMAVGSDQLFVVEGGSVRGLDLASGKLMWQTAAEEYIGAPLVFDNSLMIARRQGAVRRLDFSGAVREEWTVASSDSKDGAVGFRFGPAAGGGALWLSDEKGAIWRLGAAEHGG